MKMPSSFNTSMQVPSNGVCQTLFDVYLADRALPALTLLGIGARALLDLKFDTALDFRVRQRSANCRKIQLTIFPLGSISARPSSNH